MESNKKYVIGLDFGTDSCRALIVDVRNGDEVATGISFYPRWKAGLYCDAQSNRYRQHPLDYIESMTEAVHTALSHLTEEEIASICGLCFDTTGSTPALTDCNGMPLALNPEFAEEPDAMFILWKDHTAVREAEQINALMKERNLDYLLYEGGTYSSEWVWSKVLHVINTNSKVKEAVYSWTEHCDWMTGLVTGNTIPEKMLRSRCAAGHKAMWHERWLLSSSEVLLELNPSLNRILPHLFTQTYTSDTRAGTLTAEWAGKLGLPQGIAVAVGALDAHMGAVGASVASGVLTRIMGTSTCDIMVAEKHEIGDRCIEGICGQVDGSVLPGFIGLEAGQSAFGDIYAWFGKFMSWPLKDIPEGEAKQKVMDTMLIELTREAQALKLSENDIVALDWMNGRRTPYADQNVKGMIAGLTLGSTAPEVFKALVEATAFGSRRIVEHMKSQRLQIDSVNAIGGISKKAPFVMQTLADVLGMPIRIVRSQQTCALGAAMFAAVAAGVYSTVGEAMRYMGSDIEIEYRPDTERKKIYEILYRKYLQLAKTSYT
ncbi:ribulokinase [Bacteroides intestinalis]|uniref:Ribulokinase n=1 Tax=Bacteroides intestinalis TaxID=329854 RepID=A0AAQ0RR53_9BACE|nr:ribulokinase [Bacteroides intestinalis]RGT49282.1 ribulokinase [Bacteroides intestinalis]